MPKLEQWEIKKYWEIFRGLKPENNKLDGDKLAPVFKNSHLEQSKLTQIWDLADIDVDGKLDFEEFCIAMRLIFDLVNGNTSNVPSKLPGWLIPGSKRHLVEAESAVQGKSNNTGYESDTDDEYTLSSDFDWYMSPVDKKSYEDVYNSSCDTYGRIKFDSLVSLYESLKGVPRTDISSAWNIVNPKQSETIDKDQCLVFLHILNQRSNGRRVPRSIPPSLRATFDKEVPQYDVESKQSEINSLNAEKSKKSFASDYLNKLGSNGSQLVSSGTDFTETKGTDWEEVKLRRELEDIEKLLQKAEEAKSMKGKDQKLEMLKYEFEQLLKYKEEQVKQLNNAHGGANNLNSVISNIKSIEVQVSQLEQFLQSKKDELSELNKQIESLT